MRRYLEGDEELFLYTRYANPTVRDLEEALAAVEGGESALALSSGMAAMTTAVVSLARTGDEVLASASLYGGTVRLLTELLPRFGVTARFLPAGELERVDRLAGERSRVLIVESPTNPTLEVVDLAVVSAAAHRRGLAVIADNTFATPVLQRPLALGADLVMHSLTKALAVGAEQLVVVTGVPERVVPLSRRRGPLARLDAAVRALERRAAEDVDGAWRVNRMLATLGPRGGNGRGSWEDPATGRVYAEVDLWVIRPERRGLGPMELDGASDPATEVRQTTDDLLELGFRDAYRQFVEPVVGQSPLPQREEGKYRDTQPVGL
jgi:hypothetical protein